MERAPTIRELTESELREDYFTLLGELECGDAFRADDPAHRRWLERLIAGRALLGARAFGAHTDAGQPAGLVVVALDAGPPGARSFGHRAEVLDLGLLPGLRGQGLGPLLLRHAEDLARNDGYFAMFVATYARDRAVVAFYLREGYVPVATLPDVHGPDDEGVVYLRKRLTR